MSEEERDKDPPQEPAATPMQAIDLTSAEAAGSPADADPAEQPIDLPPNEGALPEAAGGTPGADQLPALPDSVEQKRARTSVEGTSGTPAVAGELIPGEAGAAGPYGLPLESPGAEPARPSGDDRLMAALAWVTMVILQLPLVSFVLLAAQGNRERPFQRYHAVTSILFWLATVVYEIVAAIVYTGLTIVTLGCGGLYLWVIFFLPHLLALYYALQAYNGKIVRIPLVSDLAKREGWV